MGFQLGTTDESYLFYKEKLANQMPPAVRSRGQVVRNFGMLPPAYMTASTPGPMKGGADMILGKQFTHGVMW